MTQRDLIVNGHAADMGSDVEPLPAQGESGKENHPTSALHFVGHLEVIAKRWEPKKVSAPRETKRPSLKTVT